MPSTRWTTPQSTPSAAWCFRIASSSGPSVPSPPPIGIIEVDAEALLAKLTAMTARLASTAPQPAQALDGAHLNLSPSPASRDATAGSARTACVPYTATVWRYHRVQDR